jgi:hypothetical protein
VTPIGAAEEFLRVGGVLQKRYESVRAGWMALDSPGVLEFLRMPWGRRLFHFGVLGLLDEDPTGAGRFEVTEHVSAAPVSAEAVPSPRCMRLMLPAVDAESRLREAYRSILSTLEALQRAVGE